MMRRLLMTGLAVVSLSACDTWFGQEEAPPLPGERISVLLHERSSVKPDPELASELHRFFCHHRHQIWNGRKTGGFANHAMHHIQVSGNRISAKSGAPVSEVPLTTVNVL